MAWMYHISLPPLALAAIFSISINANPMPQTVRLNTLVSFWLFLWQSTSIQQQMPLLPLTWTHPIAMIMAPLAKPPGLSAGLVIWSYKCSPCSTLPWWISLKHKWDHTTLLLKLSTGFRCQCRLNKTNCQNNPPWREHRFPLWLRLPFSSLLSRLQTYWTFCYSLSTPVTVPLLSNDAAFPLSTVLFQRYTQPCSLISLRLSFKCNLLVST